MGVALVIYVEHAASGLVWGAEVPVPPDLTIHYLYSPQAQRDSSSTIR
jgi:hypothetical protein